MAKKFGLNNMMIMKKHYICPEAILEINEPLILDIGAGSDNDGEWKPGMPVDAPRRDYETDEEKDNWKDGLW
jgi:hypothetical protein